MSWQHELAAKHKFFQELYELDDPADDAPDEGLQSSIRALSKAVALPRGKLPQASSSKLTRAVSTPVRQSTQTADDTDARHHVIRARTLSRQKTVSVTATIPVPIAVTGNARPVVKSVGPTTTDPRRIFDGLHFYFFPNNDVHPGRRFRINKAIQLGARWEKDWSNNVTHIIADLSMNFSQVAAYIDLPIIPEYVSLVNETYPADCIAYRFLVDPKEKKYQVAGAPDDASARHQKPASASDRSLVSLELKPPTLAVMARAPHTPSDTSVPALHNLASVGQTSSHDLQDTLSSNQPGSNHKDQAEQHHPSSSGNDLDKMIHEALRNKHMAEQPLDSDDEDGGDRPSSSDSKSSDTDASVKHQKRKRDAPDWQDNFQCMNKNTGKNVDCANAQTIALLDEMAEYYAQVRDVWRPVAYRKAITTLRNHPEKVTTKEQARQLPFIGERLAAKIEEIVYTNTLRRLENARGEPTDNVLKIFLKIYGVGFAQASKWIEQGYKTLDDLVSHATLTANQKVGIEHYRDFEERIPRDEVRQHGLVVLDAAHALDKRLQVHVMGSYRRGNATSGDIDLLFTHPIIDLEAMRELVLDRLVPRLFAAGFLKAALAATSRKDGTRWHGASCLPNSTVWRRIDLLLVPRHELGAALIYFTGNDIFNRSMRLLASRKGMRLNQRGLYKNTLRGPGRVKISKGELVEGADEKKIFEALGVPWRPPEHRIC